jgi:TolB-like protein
MAFPLPDKPSVAVLPFVNMSEDPKQEFLCDGFTEEIINALTKLPQVFVIARNSSFTYKGKKVDVKQVGREMGVQYVLEGSVRKEGNRIRITAQLIDSTTGRHVFSERYDRELKDIFATQDDITIKILTALRVALKDGEWARIQGRGSPRAGPPVIRSIRHPCLLSLLGSLVRSSRVSRRFQYAWDRPGQECHRAGRQSQGSRYSGHPISEQEGLRQSCGRSGAGRVYGLWIPHGIW